MSIRGWGTFALVCVSCVVGGVAFAATQTVHPSADTFVNSANPNNNNGASGGVIIGVSGRSGVMHGLIQFPMPSGLAGRVTVTQAQLTMTLAQIGGGAGSAGTAATYSLQAVTQAWVQGNGVGFGSGAFTVGQACGGGIIGATWNQTNCATATNWTTAGGTTSPTVSATANSTGVAVGGTVTWTGAQLASDVQGWIDTTSSNNGWLILSSNTSNGQAQKFVSVESSATASSLAITYACKSGFLAVGNGCTTCTAAANADCVTGQSGNTCNDSGPPSTTYSCTCGNAAYVAGTGSDGKPACVDKNECSPNHCRDAGDSAAGCTDHVAPATGYDCSCSSGFVSNGTTCIPACSAGSNPCGSGGSCTANGSGWTCNCTSGYVSTGGATPVCVDFNACDAAANGNCATAQSGNLCVDEAPPSMTYHCTCSNPAYTAGTTANGNPACVDKNECMPNHCLDGGDASATCTDHVAPATGYDCTCSAGFTGNGTTCVNDCGNGPDPCGNGGTCTATSGGWTCACPAGFASSGGAQPTCVDFNACTAAAIADCTTAAGNECIDEAPPSMSYHCTCGNPAYVGGTGMDGNPACLDKNECMPNHCTDGGDSAAQCVDQIAPATGYECTCSSPRWTADVVGGFLTCVDKDECAGGNPCGSGTCTNVASGGGYTCACNPGFNSTGGMTPTCASAPAQDSGCAIGGAHDAGGLLLLLSIYMSTGSRRRRRRHRRTPSA